MSDPPSYRYITVSLEEEKASKLYKMVIEQMIDMQDKIESLRFDNSRLDHLLNQLDIAPNMEYNTKWNKIQNAKKLLEKDKYAGV